MLPDHLVVMLIDPDRVDERNLVRQNFYAGELGQFKSQALAKRLSQKFNRRIAYFTSPISMLEAFPDVIIGCVDNGPARRDIADKITRKYNPFGMFRGWWVDSGNERNFGQVLIGNHPASGLEESFETKREICLALPLPTEQRPELLLTLPAAPACADMDEQGPVINQCMASLVLEVVWRILVGTCSWMQLNLDMEMGTLAPVLATPENVSAITGIKVKSLTFVESKGRR